MREKVGQHVGAEGMAELVHAEVVRVLAEKALVGEVERRAAPFPVCNADGEGPGDDAGGQDGDRSDMVDARIEAVTLRPGLGENECV